MAAAGLGRLAGPKKTVHDITSPFNHATSSLRPCELVKNPDFSLFEAVSAIEIMDPKMDSGFLRPGDSTEDDYDVAQHLEPAQVVGIMDELLILEAAWHMGHGLSQTLLTSIYLDRLLWPVPKSIDESRFNRITNDRDVNGFVAIILRAYCLSLIRTCYLVIVHITRQYYYEEEDFVTQIHHRNFLSNVETDQVIETVDHALVWLENEKGKGSVALGVADALCQRLFFRKSFLSSLDNSQFGDGQSRDSTFYALSQKCLQRIQRANFSTPSNDPADAPTISIPVPSAFSPKILRRLATAVPPRPPVDDISISDALEYLDILFRDAIDAHALLDCTSPYDLLNAVCTFHQRRNPPVFIRCLIQSFIQNENTPDSIDTPSSDSGQVFCASGYRSLAEFFVDSMIELVLPDSPLLDPRNETVETPTDPRFANLMLMKEFIEKYLWTFLDMYKSICMNRSRVRRVLTHSIVAWDDMQREAEELDNQLQVLNKEFPQLIPNTIPPKASFFYPLGSWAYNYKLQQLRQVVLMGFELDIYTREELGSMYYYLSYICATHIAHLDRTRYFVMQKQPNKYATGFLSPNARNRRFAHTMSVLQRWRTEVEAIHYLARALHSLYVLLDRHGLPADSRLNKKSPYYNPQRRYELRMKPFQRIQYRLPMERNCHGSQLAEYKTWSHEAGLNEMQDNWTLLDYSKSAVNQAREAWKKLKCSGMYAEPSTAQNPGQKSLEEDWAQDVNASLRACIGTSLAISAVGTAMKQKQYSQESNSNYQNGHTQGEAGAPELDIDVSIPGIDEKSRFHPFWAVPSMMTSQKQS